MKIVSLLRLDEIMHSLWLYIDCNYNESPLSMESCELCSYHKNMD